MANRDWSIRFLFVTITCHYTVSGSHEALLECLARAQLWGVQSNRWAQSALHPSRDPPTQACIQTLAFYRPHTAHTDVHTKDSCPYLPTFKPGLITSQSSVTQWASDNKRSRVGDHNFTELLKRPSFVRTNKPRCTMMAFSATSFSSLKSSCFTPFTICKIGVSRMWESFSSKYNSDHLF